MRRPHPEVRPNTFAFLAEAMIAPTGFRDYDARWRFPEEINLPGLTAVGLGLGTQIRRRGGPRRIVVGNDYRDYAVAVKQALMLGLVQAGVEVIDIGPCLSPMAYFARIHLDAPAVAMVTASHNPNGWTGVKMGLAPPFTHGPEEMADLRSLVLEGAAEAARGGSWRPADGVGEAYLDDLARGIRLSRPLRVVCATGNGTAGAFAPALLARIGAEVVPLHTRPDYSFPHYNPNPEAMEMLHDMARAVRGSGADIALGFDGDGDRCGIVDDRGEEIFADKIGLLLARDLARRHPGAHFLVDVKSTGLFAHDAELAAAGATAEYWRTGHSHMKRRMAETGALAAFEKSGHFFFGPPVGRGYDCGLRAAVEICRLLDRAGGRSLSDLHAALPRAFTSPTMSARCADTEKREVVDGIVARLERMAAAGGQLGGHRIAGLVGIDGARVALAHGGWALVRASSNVPALVVVCESPESRDDLRAIFAAVDAILREDPRVGPYDQTL